VRRGIGRGAQEERVDVLTGGGKKGNALNLGRRRRLDSAAWSGGAEARHGRRRRVRARASSAPWLLKAPSSCAARTPRQGLAAAACRRGLGLWPMGLAGPAAGLEWVGSGPRARPS
jgi:hypothetical protein